MAALSITVANVLPVTASTNYNVLTGVAAVAILQGQSVYRLSDGTIGLADANAASPAYTTVGIALAPALTGQIVSYQIAGDLDFGAILTTNVWYVVGSVAGSINPMSDTASGWYGAVLGYAITTSRMRLNIVNTGVALA